MNSEKSRMIETNSQPTTNPPGLFRHGRQDALASLVVFLVALPLCMGIALASGAPVSAGLITGIIGGLIVGSIAGSPLQVSGPAAGLTVICGEVIRQHGMPGLGLAVLAGGIIQLLAGILRLGQWFRAVSPAVIHGMLSGIGILILTSQFHVLVDDRPRATALQNIAAIPESIVKGLHSSAWEDLPTRESHTRLLRTANSLFDRQKSLQRSVEQALLHFSQSPSPADREHLQQPLLEQQLLLHDIDNTLNTAETSLSLPDHDDHSRTALDLLAKSQQSVVVAVDELQLLAVGVSADPEPVRRSQADATEAVRHLLSGLKRNDWAGRTGLVALVVIIVWQFAAKGFLKLIPAPLMAVIIATSLSQFIHIPILYVDVPDSLWTGIQLPGLAAIQDLPLSGILISGVAMAIIASAETLLCATAVDQMHNGPRTRYDAELRAQGVGNLLCGFLGVLPMTGVIVRSAANVQAGGKTRLSAVLHGVWLLLFAWALTPVLRLIPTSALAGILVYTGFRLIDFKSFRHLWHTDRPEALIFLTTVIVIICEDLLAGVVTGVVLSALRLLYRFSRLDVVTTLPGNALTLSPGLAVERPQITMQLHGAATFLRLPILASRLEKIPAGAELHVDLSQLEYIDHACLELFMNWAKQHSATGGRLIMDWDSLHARFQGTRAPSSSDSSITSSDSLAAVQ